MILNLVNAQQSDIKYAITVYPDSHPHINFDKHIGAIANVNSLVIKARLRTTDDLFILEQAVEVIRTIQPDLPISLYVSYLLASRYDRPMHDFDSNDLKIVCKRINALNFRRVTLVEPHSVASTLLIDRVEVVHPLDSVLSTFITDSSNVCFVVPDLGAVKRVETFIASTKKDIPIIYSNKHRILSTGEITGIDVFNPDDLEEVVIIYDDLCDGGRTFTELAKKLRSIKTEVHGHDVVKRIYLFVTHGIFSKGIDVIVTPNVEGSYVDRIYTTNSFQTQEERSNLTTTNII